MRLPRAQSVADADRDVRQYLIRIAGTLGELLGQDLTGLYVHGSLATGAFRRDRSNLDLILVVRSTLPERVRTEVARLLASLSESRPTREDINVDVVTEQHARQFEHPMPCEVRYGRGVWSALPARIVDARERGVTLVGPSAAQVFSPVPWYAYVNALESELQRSCRGARAHPERVVLAACRVLYGISSLRMHAANKEEAATWAMDRVPSEYRSAINDALQIYRGAKSIEDVVFAEPEVAEFCRYVRKQAEAAFRRASDTDDAE